MQFKLRVEMDNAAFDDNESEELASVLREVAIQVEVNWGRDSGTCTDSNGNTVAFWEVEQ